MNRILVGALAAVVIATSAAPVHAQSRSGQTVTLPANSDVLVRLDEEVTSKSAKVGDTFGRVLRRR